MAYERQSEDITFYVYYELPEPHLISVCCQEAARAIFSEKSLNAVIFERGAPPAHSPVTPSQPIKTLDEAVEWAKSQGDPVAVVSYPNALFIYDKEAWAAFQEKMLGTDKRPRPLIALLEDIDNTLKSIANTCVVIVKDQGDKMEKQSGKKKTIEFKVDKWVEAELKGNYRCPHCGRTMVVIWGFVLCAYCPHCGRYFLPERLVIR